MLDLLQLRYFVAVAEEEHVGRAAERLSLSPSPLSRQVRSLEERLGMALFDRSGNRLRLTAHGHDFLIDARALLELAETVEVRALDVAAGRTGTLTIGYVEGALHCGMLPSALRRFSKERPEVRLELSLLRTAEQHRALDLGTLDLAVTYAPHRDHAEIVSTLAIDEPFVLALPADHPFASGELNPGELSGAPFITAARAHEQVAAMCAAAGFEPDLRYEAAEPTAVLALVAAGLGLAIVQHSLSQPQTPGVAFRPFPCQTQRLQIHVAHRSHAGPAARRLAQLLNEAGTERSASSRDAKQPPTSGASVRAS